MVGPLLGISNTSGHSFKVRAGKFKRRASVFIAHSGGCLECIAEGGGGKSYDRECRHNI